MLDGIFALGCGPGTDYPQNTHISMYVRTNKRYNEWGSGTNHIRSSTVHCTGKLKWQERIQTSRVQRQWLFNLQYTESSINPLSFLLDVEFRAPYVDETHIPHIFTVQYVKGQLVTVRLKLSDPLVTIFRATVGKHESVPRNIRRDRRRCGWSLL